MSVPKKNSEFTNTLATFRYRAARLRYTSFGILGIIILLLLGGATAFILAPQITLSDFYADTDLDKKLKDIDSESAKIQETISKERAEWRSPLSSAYKIYEDLLTVHGTRVSDRPTSGVDVNISNAIVFTRDIVVQLLRQASASKPIIRIQLENPPGIRESSFDLKQEKLDTVVAALLAATMPASGPTIGAPYKPDQKLSERKDLLDAARVVLQQKKTEQGLATLLGKQTAEAKTEPGSQGNASRVGSDVPLAQLLQTNLTRFGTIIMITFLVSILTPLYRYNIRLATYYDARADVLELFDSKLKSVGFLSLAAALTPTFDFGKAPDTPIEQIIRLARELSDTKGSHGKSN